MKKQYESFELNVNFFLDYDVITTSGPIFEQDSKGDYGTDIFGHSWNK